MRILILSAILGFNLLSAQIPTANLIGYYPFSGNTNDLSGNGNNGINNGATLTMDRFCIPNSAYSFNGMSDYIKLPTFNNLNTYSYSLWLKSVIYQPSPGGIVFCAGGSQDPYCQGLTYQPAGNIFAGSYNLGNNPIQSYVQSSIVVPGQWVHVVVIRNINNIRLFINGVMVPVLATSNTNNQAPDYGTLTWVTLGMRSNSSTHFNGLIDDVRIYSSSLSQADVTALYNENVNSAMTASGSQICVGSSAILSASSPASTLIYWNTNPTVTNALGTGNTYTTPVFNSAGTYTYYAISGCTLSAAALVTVSPLPSISLTAVPPVICPGATAVITASGANTYFWNNNSTGNSISVSPANSTNFTVAGISEQGCVALETIHLAVGCTSQSEDQTPDDRIAIYPNPSQGIFYFQAAGLTNVQIIVQDLQGRQIGYSEISEQNETASLDLRGSASGVYLFSAFSDGQWLYTKKILLTN